MTIASTSARPRNFPAEFAALMAEQADLTRRAFRLFEEACLRPTEAPVALDWMPVGGLLPAEAPVQAAAVESLPEPETYAPPASTALALHTPETPKTSASPPPEPTKSTRDLVLDLYASTKLEVWAIAAQLGLGAQKVAGTIGGSRRWKEPRAIAGDALRRGSTVAATAPAPTVLPKLAPAPRAPQKPSPKPAAPPEPLPPIRSPADAKARADARDNILRHYGATGDYDSQIAQKLGYLRSWVTAFIYEAREAGDPRIPVGDSRRRSRER